MEMSIRHNTLGKLRHESPDNELGGMHDPRSIDQCPLIMPWLLLSSL